MRRDLGMGGHHSARAGKDEWLTPRPILYALGDFDLDPCAADRRPWPTASAHFTAADDGLTKEWSGRVWCNPPYGAATAFWLKRCADHGDAVALIFARTETAMFFDQVWERADAVLFIRGRLTFCHASGQPGLRNAVAPSCLVAYGRNNVATLAASGIDGHLVLLHGRNVNHDGARQRELA